MSRGVALPAWIRSATPAHHEVLTVEVAFRDCDPMGVLWHGNYLAYVELARNALGRRIGFGIDRLRDLALFAPVVRSQVWHHAPARPGEVLTITASLFATNQPRLFHRYHLSVGDRLVAEAETDQVLTDREFTLLLQQPPALAALFQIGPV